MERIGALKSRNSEKEVTNRAYWCPEKQKFWKIGNQES
jgi:hypothetical protein